MQGSQGSSDVSLDPALCDNPETAHVLRHPSVIGHPYYGPRVTFVL